MILAPSILAADFGHLAEEIARAEQGGARLVHLDVMDGHFVPNLTMGPAVVKAVRRATRLPLDVHLMIQNADLYVDAFADAGANWVSLHVEALPHLQRAVAHLRERGLKAGVALNPSTPLVSVEEIAPELDYVVVMSVNPGFGAQPFISNSLHKLRKLRELRELKNLNYRIEVDGGIAAGTIAQVVRAGAEILVAGNAVFSHGDPMINAQTLLKAALDATLQKV